MDSVSSVSRPQICPPPRTHAPSPTMDADIPEFPRGLYFISVSKFGFAPRLEFRFDCSLTWIARMNDDAITELNGFSRLQFHKFVRRPVKRRRRHETVIAGEPRRRKPFAGRMT